MLEIKRHFTKEGIHPFDEINWIKRDVSIIGTDGEVIFEQKGIEAPDFWSDSATKILANKYLYGKLGTTQRETSAKDLINRVAETLSYYGKKDNYFDEYSADIFMHELKMILINQKAMFNSPVLFNCGVEHNNEGEPLVNQSAACFLNSVDDTIESITELVKTEALIFKFGSGSGVSLNKLRSKNEYITGGGKSSGIVEFMKLHDANAMTVKSGGKSRRAAKLVCIDATHPDIIDFIECKSKEEDKAKVLIEAGYSYDEATNSVFYQNGNHSVRLNDAFMDALIQDDYVELKAITTGEVLQRIKAKEIFRKIANETHRCGDPAIHFSDTMEKWNTCKTSGSIETTNPCSEITFLNENSCNLASINVNNFINKNKTFDLDGFIHCVRIMFIAQDILIHNATYPIDKIRTETLKYRIIGQGITNLGTMIMNLGYEYNSEEGRSASASILGLLTATAYKTSQELGKSLGEFEEFHKNKKHFFDIFNLHKNAIEKINVDANPFKALANKSYDIYNTIVNTLDKYPLRNAQTSCCAPTGSISFILDCQSTGIEPMIGTSVYKKLSDGSTLDVTPTCIIEKLEELGYSKIEISKVQSELNNPNEIRTILKDEHISIFETALGKYQINTDGHLNMLAAIQPHISMGISKTLNMPSNTSIEQIEDVYFKAWELGIKCVAIYRDGSKNWQPLNNTNRSTGMEKVEEEEKEERKNSQKKKEQKGENTPKRHKLPDERQAITHKFSIGGHEGYVTVGMYEDGSPGELFIVMNKEGSTISGLMDAFATSVSMALQHHVPLEKLCEKFVHMRFEPSGFTQHKDIRIAKSIPDYIFRWLQQKFNSDNPTQKNGSITDKLEQDSIDISSEIPDNTQEVKQHDVVKTQSDSPLCSTCGTIMFRKGTCYYCDNCGATTGCS